MQKIIAIDFDGTIAADAYPGIGDMLPRASEVINSLYDNDFIIVIWTCRQGALQHDAEKWLFDHGIKYHYFNANIPGQTTKYGYDSRKIGADVFIDDRNLGGFPGWEAVADALLPADPVFYYYCPRCNILQNKGAVCSLCGAKQTPEKWFILKGDENESNDNE